MSYSTYTSTPFLLSSTARLNLTARRSRNFTLQCAVNLDTLAVDLSQVFIRLDIATVINPAIQGSAETVILAINSSTGVFADRFGNLSAFVDNSLLQFGNSSFDTNTSLAYIDYQYRIVFLTTSYSAAIQVIGGGFRLFR